ncbi:MAG: hypothetical protein JWM16_5901 [Verrucomicrobiales bacterium]|nr:hypothetical protein [Verrucomicrobiales bacterium]
MHEQERIFWAGDGEADPIAVRVEQVISELEAICRPIIAGDSLVGAFLFKHLWGRVSKKLN